MTMIYAQDLKIGMRVKNHHGRFVTVKDVVKASTSGAVYVTYDELHETGRYTFEEDIKYRFYLTAVEVQ